jgi:hypothetical protein
VPDHLVVRRGAAAAALVALAACSPAPARDLGALSAEVSAIVDLNKPRLDLLVGRIAELKRDLRHNLPGWQEMLRAAELANDALGLPPFVQVAPPGPGWAPSKASLLGMGPYAKQRAAELAKAGQRAELAFLVDDTRRRYVESDQEISEWIDLVDRWLVANGVPITEPPRPAR